MEDNFILDILGSLKQNKSKKQINSDIKQLEKTINMLRITGTFAKGNTKRELNAYIKSLQSQLNYVKLTAKIDGKNVKREIDNALHGMKFKDIDVLNIDENKTKLKARKVIADVKALAEGSPITVNLEYRKNKLNNDLTTYLNKNTKITESSILLKESEKIRKLIDAIDDKKSLTDATDAFRLFKSEVSATGFTSKSTADKIKSMLGHITKIGSAFGVASMAINNFVKSLQTLRSNDTILTEISKTSEMTKQQLKELGDEAFKTASKYGQLSSNYLLAVQEMARSGYEDTSKELGKLSLLAQSAGDMTADSANNYLLATDAAYKYSGSIEKLNAALDGANYISNKNSATLTNIADATRVSASFAANAGVAIDELTAAEATMIAVTKRSGSEIGRAFRSIILNLQGVSGEFDGEVIDEEQLKKVEARCHSLGVELEYMKDGMATLRNPMEVLKDLADVYNSLPDNSAEKQGLISDLGGKFHANSLSSLLSRWDMYEKMLEEFSQGTGSALEEAEKTANSWEGRLAALRNSWDSFINVLTNKEAIMNGISLFDRMIQGAESFVDTFGTIPTVLTAINTSMIAMHKDYGLTKVWDRETGKIDLEGNIFGIDFSAIKNQKKHFEEAEQAISIWNNKLRSGKNNLEAFNYSVVQNSAQLKEYLATCSKDAPGSLSGYQQYLQSTGQATEGLRLKTLLLNTALTMLGGIAVQLIITGIQKAWDTLNVTVEEQEQKINELKSSYEGLKSEYDELSQKQDVTDAEKRRLEYLERRLELDERILKAEQAQLFDEKTGNKFTDLFDKDNLQTQYLGEMNIRNNDGYAGQKFKYNNRTDDIAQIHERIARLKELQATVEEGTDKWRYYQAELDTLSNQETKHIDSLSEQENQLTINLGKYADNIEFLQSQLDSGDLTEDQTATAKEQLAEWQKMYDQVELMINEIQKLNGTYSDENKIKDILSQPEFEKTTNQLEELGKSGKLSVTTLSSSFPELINRLDEAGISAQELYQYIMSLSDADIDGSDIVNLDLQRNQTKQRFGGYSYNDRGVQATNEAGRIFDDFWDEYVKTAEQADIVNSPEFQKALDKQKESLDSVTLSVENYSKALEEAQNKIAEASFDQVWADLVASEDDAVKELDADLLELAEKGRLTVDTFNEADSTGYFKNLGISADIAVSKINKLVDESKQLSSMSDQISKMSEALGTKKENGFVEADTLSSFDVEVRGLESWDRFQAVLGSTTSSYEECQEAANELATEWVNSSDFLAQLTEDTKEYYETQLESMGIENYEEVIESTLALKEAKEALADVDLSDASYEDIEALIAEGEYSALVTEQMWALYYAKLAESGTFLDSSADCAQLQALANDAMLTAEAVELLNQLIQIYNGLEAGAYNNNRALRAEAVAEASRIKSELENLAKGEGVGLIAKPELKVNGNKGKKSGGGSGSSKDLWKEAYNAELKELEHMHNLGLISDEEYWKARMDLNEKYFGESSGMHEKYLDEYQENEEDILEGLKKLWEDYYDERKNNLKDLISYAEKLYDREIDSLEANIKQIEEKRDTEKKYWQGRIDAIGDEIDALEDANDQRERAIDLQEKQYQLQKTMHQRAILLYSESKGMHYVNDSKAERSAKNDLDGAENDNKIADLKKQQKDLEKQLDAILETYDSQIESIEKQIDSLKEVKSAWSEIVENQEFKELEERLKSLFGDDIKSKILSGNTDFINDIIAQYSDTSDMLRTIEDATRGCK